ncbi:hypothetical protein Ancab_018201 [Ancistrocladus abbreviatus]
MRTSLRKLQRALQHHKNDRKDRKVQPLAQLDELAKASDDMSEMRDCYDSLLSAAAGAANSAYEFSESLREMGACLLQKIALNDDEEAGRVLLMIGRVQFELQRLVDSYRSHIFQTITVPSESLLNELHTVEEMKRQCDEKRKVYEYMKTRLKEKGRRSGKGESFSSQQLQVARDEFDEEATLFVFRLKSLKQGQSRSLLTQAARHHAAQLSFFRKGLKSLESLEPHVKSVTEQQHIDYQFSGLDDDESEDGEDDSYYDDGDTNGSDVDSEGELSFDYRRNDHMGHYVSAARQSMELDVDITFPSISRLEATKENLVNIYEGPFIREPKQLSKSAPLFPHNKIDQAERIRQLRPSSTKKFHSYVLPKPGDTKSSLSTGSESTFSETKTSPSYSANLCHSLPLEPNKYEKLGGTENFSGPIIPNSQSVLKENNTIRPWPFDRISSSQLSLLAASNSKRNKRLSYSGPLIMSKFKSNKPSLYAREPPLFSSGPILRGSLPYSSSPKISPSTSPTFISSPRINELHELPRPPAHLLYNSTRPSGFVGYSAPLVSRGQENYITNKLTLSKVASPLPTPPQASPNSSIPSSSPRELKVSPSSNLLEAHSHEKAEDSNSPPQTPSSLQNAHTT